jgi:hypothetical protein
MHAEREREREREKYIPLMLSNDHGTNKYKTA